MSATGGGHGARIVRFFYILAEIIVTWVVLTALGGLFIWGWSGFDSLGQLIMVGYTAIALGASIKLVLIGDQRSLLTGRYRPVRILSTILTGIGAFRRNGTGHRNSFVFDFRGSPSVSAYDVIDALSAMLRDRGIPHSKSAGVLVEDNGTTWWLEPELGANRVMGWVESENRQSRDQVVGGIREFLERDMRLQVA